MVQNLITENESQIQLLKKKHSTEQKMMNRSSQTGSMTSPSAPPAPSPATAPECPVRTLLSL
jgi:hypothetical protein